MFDATTLENGIYLAASGQKYGGATNGVRSGTKIKVLPNTAYTLSVQSSEKVALRIFEWSNGAFTKQTPVYNISGSISLTVTTTAETTEIAFNIEGADGQYATNIMLNAGSTALPYEPYGYKIPLTVNGTEYPIYLGEVETTRKIKKLVLTGNENWAIYSGFSAQNCYQFNTGITDHTVNSETLNTHFVYTSNFRTLIDNDGTFMFDSNSYIRVHISSCATVEDFKSYLAQQYQNGTPVTVWYVLAEPETGIVNEPLHKINGYADTITMAQAGETIPTIAGSNTLSVGTTVQPSEVSITGNIKS